MQAGEEIGLKIDQTLTQDATGTLVMLEASKPWASPGQDRGFRPVRRSQPASDRFQKRRRPSVSAQRLQEVWHLV